MIEVKKLYKTYRLPNNINYNAVNNVSFNINRNEIIGLVGESGSGKSTLARLIIKIENSTKGDIFFDGVKITNFTENELFSFRKKMQIVFQDPFSSLNPKLRIKDSLNEGLLNFNPKLKINDALYIIKEKLLSLGLKDNDITKYPHEFSGGQRQRIAILRALIVQPELLICDEIVSALDVSVRGSIINLLKVLKDNMKLSLLFISHDLPLTNMISDRIMVMYSGYLLEIIPKGFLEKAKHPYTKFLVSHSFNKKFDTDMIDLKYFEGQNNQINENSCPYYSYCKDRMHICLTKKLESKILENEHEVFCHLY